MVNYRLQNGTILKFLLMFLHNEFSMQKGALVTFMPFLKIHNFIIYEVSMATNYCIIFEIHLK